MPSSDTRSEDKPANLPEQVPSESYDRAYYLQNMEGGELFVSTGGRKITPRHAKILSMTTIKPGARVLDVGCGRGELVLQAGLLGANAKGVDYSKDAIALANDALATPTTMDSVPDARTSALATTLASS